VDNRYVTLPDFTLYALRKYWSTYRNPLWLFPEGRTAEQRVVAKKPMTRGGSQVSFQKIVVDCNIHKAITIHSLRHCTRMYRCREAHGCARAATATGRI
jgi:integrase